MRKLYGIFLLIALITMVTSCYSQDINKNYLLKNNFLALTLTQTLDNNIYFSKILDIKSGVNFISEVEQNSPLWILSVKKSRDYTADEILLTPKDAEKVLVSNIKNKIVISWTIVKSNIISNGFDVTVTGELNGSNSLWDIKVKTNSKDYGIWSVTFPNIDGIDCANGNDLLTPTYGGMIEKDNSSRNYGELKFPSSSCPFQFISLTKEKSSLYIAPEDNKGYNKTFSWDTLKPYKMTYKLKLYPENMGIASYDYKQDYKVNIAVFEGDWFDAAKKYRKWGIDNKYAPYARGKIDQRTDFPNWMKTNVAWGGIKDKNILDVPVAMHIYDWWTSPHDTRYPDMLPANKGLDVYTNGLRDAGVKYMLYTNAHLVDVNNSLVYKKYGDNILTLGPDMKPYNFDWGKVSGAENHSGCISVPEYFNAVVDLQKQITKDFNVDAIYLDEVCITPPEFCFNEKHGHPIGGGARWTKEYTRLMNTVKEETSKIKSEPMLITSEGICVEYPVDACLHLLPHPFMPPITTILYSGYVSIFGTTYFANEFTDSEQPAINKTAMNLVNGWQLGWRFYSEKPWWEYENFTKYYKGAAKAREAAIKYFNLGEMVREVDFKTKIPTINTFFNNGMGTNHQRDYPMIRTSSFNYKDVTAVVFTNAGNTSFTFDWESNNKNLYLTSKSKYSIVEVYPNNKNLSNKSGKINGTITMEPLETKVILIK